VRRPGVSNSPDTSSRGSRPLGRKQATSPAALSTGQSLAFTKDNRRVAAATAKLYWAMLTVSCLVYRRQQKKLARVRASNIFPSEN
jgi:hypothetical protein